MAKHIKKIYIFLMVKIFFLMFLKFFGPPTNSKLEPFSHLNKKFYKPNNDICQTQTDIATTRLN